MAFREEQIEKNKWNVKVSTACFNIKQKEEELIGIEKEYFQGKSIRYVSDRSWNSIRSSIDENCYKTATDILGPNISLEFGIALKELYKKDSISFRDILRLYKQTLDELSSLEEKAIELFSPAYNAYSEYSNHLDNHYFLNTGTDLVCVYCGETIKKYMLPIDEDRIIKRALKNSGRILPNATNTDLAMIEVMVASQSITVQDSKKEETPVLDWADLVQGENTSFVVEKESLPDSEARNFKLKQLIDIAHTTGISAAYFSKYEARKQIKQVNQEIREIDEKSDPAWRDLLLEQCRIAKYEVRILAGENISELYRKARTEEEKSALCKAYYYLLNNYYKENSGYFKNPNDADTFSCATTDSDINKLILEMKKR